MEQTNSKYRVGHKNFSNCLCLNFLKSLSNLIIFDTQMAKTIELCEVYSFFTSPNLCQRTAKRRCSKLLHCAVTISIRLLTRSSLIRQTAPRHLIFLWYWMLYAENSRRQNTWLMTSKYIQSTCACSLIRWCSYQPVACLLYTSDAADE